MTPSRSEKLEAIRVGIAHLLLVLLVPVCATLASGGADWHVRDAGPVSWYHEWIAWPMLGALAIGLWLRPGHPHRSRPSVVVALLDAGGLLAMSCATWILWTGGARLPFVSLRSPEPSGAIAVAACLLAGILARASRHRAARLARIAGVPAPPPVRARKRVTRGLALGLSLAAGLLLQLLLVRSDAARITASLASARERSEAAGIARASSTRDVVWIVVDTLRADAIGVYREIAATQGRALSAVEEARTPGLDALAASGVVFERVLAPAPWTVPSMMSALTSRWPSSLDPDGRGRARGLDERIGLDASTPTWIAGLRAAGYHTAGFQKNPFLGPGSGFELGFDVYRMVGGDRAELESAQQLVRAVLRWGRRMAQARTAGSETPFLLYVHFMEPHIDYRAPRQWWSHEARAYAGPVDGRASTLHARLAQTRTGEQGAISAVDRDQLRRLYAAEVAYLDAQLTSMLEGLRAQGLVDDETLVVVTGDHGEQFAEHGGWEHGDLYIENLHVPFIATGAGLSAGRVAGPASLVDLAPTLLALLDMPDLPGAEGQDLLAAHASDRDRASVGPRSVVSEYGARARLERDGWVLVEGRRGDPALYAVESDPGEQHDLSQARPDRLAELVDALERHRARLLPSESSRRLHLPPELDPETADALRALGYAR